jgi:uncharacterized protein
VGWYTFNKSLARDRDRDLFIYLLIFFFFFVYFFVKKSILNQVSSIVSMLNRVKISPLLRYPQCHVGSLIKFATTTSTATATASSTATATATASARLSVSATAVANVTAPLHTAATTTMTININTPNTVHSTIKATIAKERMQQQSHDHLIQILPQSLCLIQRKNDSQNPSTTSYCSGIAAKRTPHRAMSMVPDMSQLFSVKPFHLAVPVHDIKTARAFYGDVLELTQGRSADRWQDYSLFGHQLVCHEVSPDYRAQDHFNPVDKDDVPVPHFGVCLSVDEFKAFAVHLHGKGVDFVIPPTLRFKGQEGEQWTMFFRDPSGNSLEFKAMTKPENLFAKYHVTDGH